MGRSPERTLMSKEAAQAAGYRQGGFANGPLTGDTGKLHTNITERILHMHFIDFHCDTLALLYDQEIPEASADTASETNTLWDSRGHLDLTRLLDAGYLAQFFACFVNMGNPPRAESHFADALAMCGILKGALARDSRTALARNRQEYQENKDAGALSCFLTVEEGGILENCLERLETLYRQGVRLLTLTWNYENCIGFSHKFSGRPDTGLKPFGFHVLEEMERLGILADVSHLSDEGFYDVYRHSRRPFLASHSCCRALCGHSRNLTDDMIRKTGERQGVVGVNFYGAFLQENGESTIEAIVRHIRHVIHTGGRQCAALGTDFDGMGGFLELDGCEKMPRLAAAMEQAGFTTGEIEDVCFRNAERMLGFL